MPGQKKPKSKTMSISIDEDRYNWLKGYAERQDLSMSFAIRKMIDTLKEAEDNEKTGKQMTLGDYIQA